MTLIQPEPKKARPHKFDLYITRDLLDRLKVKIYTTPGFKSVSQFFRHKAQEYLDE